MNRWRNRSGEDLKHIDLFLMRELFNLLDIFSGEEEIDLFVQNLHIIGYKHSPKLERHKVRQALKLLIYIDYLILEGGISKSVVLRRQTPISTDNLNTITGFRHIDKVVIDDNIDGSR
jgi:hypothetical protein